MLDKIDLQRAKSSKGVVGLTVGEMIARLELLDPLAPVLMSAENGGLEEVGLVLPQAVCLNVNQAEGFGPHEVSADGETADAEAVLLLPASTLTPA